MKLLITLLLICFAQIAYTQNVFEYTTIDSSADSKSILFGKAMAWIAQTYKSSSNVIQLSDKENGKIIGKAVIRVRQNKLLGTYDCDGTVYYTFTIDIKDGKYRCKCSDFYHKSCNSSSDGGSLDSDIPAGGMASVGKKNWKSIKDYCEADIVALLRSLRSHMRIKTDDF